MKTLMMIRHRPGLLAWCGAVALALAGHLAVAAELQSLAWTEGAAKPVLQIAVDSDVAYKTESREGGQWLRLSFPLTKLGKAVADLEGQQYVSGVYASMELDGTTAMIDVVLDRPGRMNLQKSANGYTATIEPAPAPTTDAAPVTTPAAAPVAAANEIKEIVYAKLPGERVQVTVRMARRPSEPSTFSITSPARIALDFPDTRVAMPNKTVPVREGALTSVSAIEADNRTRLVLNLIKPVGYTAVIDGNNYVLTVNSPTVNIGGAGEQPKVTRFASARESGKFSLKSIDFRRGAQADGKIVIKLSDPSVGVDIREQAGEILLDFHNTTTPAELQRRLDVIDFATPVQTIDTFTQGRNTRMVITPKGRYEHLAYQAGDVFTVNIKPIVEKPDDKKTDEFGYSGEKLSLNFQSIDVRAALQVLADFTGLNFVISDTVKGNLTLRLKDVPWDQALDLIVDTKNLAVRRKGNVVTVAPAPEVAAKEKAAFEASKASLELEPLVSELIQINYAKADDVASLLKSIKAVTTPGGAAVHPVFGAGAAGGTTGAATDSNSLLSPRGQVTVDSRTNSLLVQDTPGKIREIRKLISKLDQPVRQVLIETRLVEATETFAQSLGVRLGHVRTGRRSITTGQHTALEPLVNTNTVTYPDVFNVNLPSAGVGGKTPAAFTLDIIRGSTLIDLELSALEQEGKGKIVSSPRIITANQKKALIEQGQERVFTTSVLGVGTVVTKKATLKLEVTPQITPDDRVNLDVNIAKDNFADASSGLLNVKQINTNVLLDNGETVVIGGIYEQDRNDTVTKVPFFGDIPLLGWLFRSKEVQDSKTELLIFLTPRIVAENLTLR
jgi:type IV pilus assembly protein PilQ